MAKGVYVGVDTVTGDAISTQTLRYTIGVKPGYVSTTQPYWSDTNRCYQVDSTGSPVRMGPNNTWYDIWKNNSNYRYAIIDESSKIFYGLNPNGFTASNGHYEERVGIARKVNKIYIGVQSSSQEMVNTKSVPGMFSATERQKIGTACKTFGTEDRSTEHEVIRFIPTSSARTSLSFDDWWTKTDPTTGKAYISKYPCFIFQNKYTAVEIVGSTTEISTLEQTARKITKGYIGAPGDVLNATLSYSQMQAKLGTPIGARTDGLIGEAKPRYTKPGDFTWYYSFDSDYELSASDEWEMWMVGDPDNDYGYKDFPFAILDSDDHYYYERTNYDENTNEYQFKEYTRGSVARQFWPAITLDPTFANNSWANIIYACQNKIVPDTWAVGDQKSMSVNGTNYAIDIIGKNHDTYSDGSGKAPLTFQFHKCWSTVEYAMNNSATNYRGWDACIMRTAIMPEVISQMPSEVQVGLKEVDKSTNIGSGTDFVKTSSDKLFLLSEIEIFGSRSYSSQGEGEFYQYYLTQSNRIKQLGTNNISWWSRSPNATDSYGFVYAKQTGGSGTINAQIQYGVAPAFCF